MAVYIYDASFEGFLSCVYASYYQETATDIVPRKNYLGSLFEAPVEIITEEEKSTKVYKAIQRKISKEDLRRIYRVFNSSLPSKEMALLNYIKLGFKLGDQISLHHADPVVRIIEKAHHQVGMEIERMLGLTRFSALNGGILYAKIETDHDVLEFIAPHFNDRLKNDPFILHDFSRDKAVISQNGQWVITEFTQKDFGEIPLFSESELELRLLWKKYFESIAIKERINPNCQKNRMPVRYWKNLTELL